MQTIKSIGTRPRALSVAGSDSAGCAGIQADLRTFAALRVHGMSVITAVTAQDTQRLFDTVTLPLESISLQIDVVARDLGVDSVKTGMLASTPVIELVASKMQEYAWEKVVVDPVMITTGGDSLIQRGDVSALLELLFPKALVVTPNLPEAQVLAGMPIRSPADMKEAARRIRNLGARCVVVKGGHLEDSRLSTDVFFNGQDFIEFQAPRIQTRNSHGSGCTFASAIAAGLARGLQLRDAIQLAKEFVTAALRHSYSVGRGSGPLGHFEAGEEIGKAEGGGGKDEG